MGGRWPFGGRATRRVIGATFSLIGLDALASATQNCYVYLWPQRSSLKAKYDHIKGRRGTPQRCLGNLNIYNGGDDNRLPAGGSYAFQL